MSAAIWFNGNEVLKRKSLNGRLNVVPVGIECLNDLGLNQASTRRERMSGNGA